MHLGIDTALPHQPRQTVCGTWDLVIHRILVRNQVTTVAVLIASADWLVDVSLLEVKWFSINIEPLYKWPVLNLHRIKTSQGACSK